MGFLNFIILLASLAMIVELIYGALPFMFITVVLVALFAIIRKHNPINWFLRFRIKRAEKKYYNSEKFLNTKQRVEKYIKNCNELNEHISRLQEAYVGINQLDYGKADYYDTSYYNYVRPEYDKHSQKANVYNCSRTICDNARKQPFKYVCKYFELEPTENTLEEFENLLNNLEAAKLGKKLLNREKNRILDSIQNEVPKIIKQYGYYKFQRELGFKVVGFDELEFPRYIFQYVSPGGNASTRCDVIMDIDNLNRFIKYLSETIKFKKSIEGQRALMTSALRMKILKRDNYTCQKCKNTIRNEPNLLLEVDHIKPLSKGGMTTEDNLQVLCWRCNRSKGSKIF